MNIESRRFLRTAELARHIESGSWNVVAVHESLPGRGRSVLTMKVFEQHEVVCDYGGDLLEYKAGKEKCEKSEENAIGYIFLLKYSDRSLWRDATEERPGLGRLLNHSKCHSNVSK